MRFTPPYFDELRGRKLTISFIMTQKVAHKIEGKFYPLHKEELLNLRKVKLINNIAFVHFALKYENPFCDRPVAVIIKEFALRWSIPEGSL
jgi:hypothetical protein